MAKRYWIDNREFFFPDGNEYTAVCWYFETKRDEVITKAKRTVIESQMRRGKPYIVFADIRQFGKEYYLRDDTPVMGGLDVEFAKKIRDELDRAIEYMKSL